VQVLRVRARVDLVLRIAVGCRAANAHLPGARRLRDRAKRWVI
jgi:hypothetical protein